MFESFANSERYKTYDERYIETQCLRALLIQKDTKHEITRAYIYNGLRALLIQKDTKRQKFGNNAECSLRALLIQKDTKRC